MRLCEEHRVQHWRVPFLGLQAIPPELTDFEIRYFFSYTAKERAAIFSRYGDRHRLAVALQIGMLKMTGRTLDAFETVPPPVLRHLQRIFPAHFGERRIISEGYLYPCSIM